MSILCLELKRLLKTPVTLILLLSCLLISLIMSYLPISYVHYNYLDSNGQNVTIAGAKAIDLKKRIMVQGPITSDKIQKAIKNYQEVTNKYGNIYADTVPQNTYNKKILPVEYIINRLTAVYSDKKSGVTADLNKISPYSTGENFYKKYPEQIKDSLVQPSAQEQALNLYEKVNKPFEYIYGYGSSDASDYLVILIFLLVIIFTFITASIFSSEYQTGSDSILRCTKHGRGKLAASKIISAILICGITFTICIFIFVMIENNTFGWESLKTSLQSINGICLPALNVGQAQKITIAAGMLTMLAVVSFNLFLSSRCKNTTNSLILSMVFFLLPLILSAISSNNITNWIQSILPSAGAELASGFYYELTKLNFLSIGSFNFWSPYVMVTAEIIAVPLFLILTVLCYCKHRSW
ncbi:ABC transporter permease [Clostridium tyrobutyricum]|uniref:ABC transporter permease n=1 Tax=Clostridium tyrobutyricum TaxID=1519 RepID=UPI001C390F68|nr:ABC transporter permease [Clostridium tyrobutyricum]MBV4439812.1 ABC transporter permease [Clostridium tyrobutyricum]